MTAALAPGAVRRAAIRQACGSGGKTRRGHDAALSGARPGASSGHHISPLAQKYFDQGLAFTYGFNHDEAERSFEQAAQIDPKLAMAYWGIALVLGPNYNLPGDPARGKKAYDAVAQAPRLKPGASPEERDADRRAGRALRRQWRGINARSDQAYANAMRTVAHKYPDDLDVQTLFAESLMDLHPWRLVEHRRQARPDTIEIVTTLETVLKKDPNHIGANHYYIHAVEASPDPSRAMASADRLGALAPGAGHLVHMPSHIYIRTGRFHDAAEANASAIKADKAFFAKTQGGRRLSADVLHAQHPLPCYAQMIEGRQRDALASARVLETKVPLDAVRAMPMAEFLVPMPYLVEARFGLWDDDPERARAAQGSAVHQRDVALRARARVQRERKSRAGRERAEAARSDNGGDIARPPVGDQ